MLSCVQPSGRASSRSTKPIFPFVLSVFAFGVGISLSGLTLFGCARTSGQSGDTHPSPQDEVQIPALPLRPNGPLLRLEKTGGFVGYMQALDVQGDGRWRVTSLLDSRELGRGAFSPGHMDSLRAAITHVPKSAYGIYPAPGADLFFIRLVIHAAPDAPSVEGVWPSMGLEGKEAGVPIVWNPCLELLEVALREAKAWR